VNDPDRGRLAAVLNRLAADPRQWPLLYEEGDVAVFGWRDPKRAGADDLFRGMELDLDQLAFHPAADRKAPAQPSDRAAEAPPWWQAFWQAPPSEVFDHEDALLRLLHAEALRRSAGPWQLMGWQSSQFAALVGASGGWAHPVNLLDLRVRLAMVDPRPSEQPTGVLEMAIPEHGALVLQQGYALQLDDTPPALLYLAVRAARRAAAVNPADARAYEVLGEAYLRLRHSTRERAWGQSMPELFQLRSAQASTAFNQAIVLKPDYAEAHLQLGGLYHALGYYDLALDHLRTYVKLADDQGPPAGMEVQQFREQEVQYHELVDKLAEDVRKANDDYTIQSVGLPVVRRAMLAFEKHLAGKARDLLLASDVSAFGKDGMAMELELLLRTGRAKDVYAWTGPDQEAVLQDAGAYHWLRAKAMAGTGNYAMAEKECAAMAPFAGLSSEAMVGMTSRAEMAILVGRRVLEECPGAGLPYQLRWPFGRPEFADKTTRVADAMRQEANVAVLWGLLALEQGEMDDARFAFRKALGYWRDEATAASGGGQDFEGRVLAQQCLEWLGPEPAP
jgi:tetratricopeptide (TPR) repeat protein